jgi:hypothetical protein
MIDYVVVFLVVVVFIIPIVGGFWQGNGYSSKSYIEGYRDGLMIIAIASVGLFAVYLFFKAAARILISMM